MAMQPDEFDTIKAPLFSIITVALNCEATLPRTLRSIEEQTCHLYEYIFVDGASTDRTVEMVRNARVRDLSLSSEPDSGIYDAMNKGLARARGEYVMFLNAGDSLHSPDTLQILADVIMDNDFPGIVYGQTDIVNNAGHKVADRHLQAPEVLTFESFRNGMVVCHQAFVALRKIVQPYDLRYRLSSDYDWCLRCLKRSRRNAYADAVIVDYLKEGLTTRHRWRSLSERFRIMAHYYGFLPTLWRHIKFLPRFVKRHHQETTWADD